MRSFRQWLVEDLGYSLIPPNIPRTQTGIVGNELRTDAGRSARERSGESENRFNQFLNKFKTKITELPVPRFNKQQKGLGDLGMDIIGKLTFGYNNESCVEWTKKSIKNIHVSINGA